MTICIYLDTAFLRCAGLGVKGIFGDGALPREGEWERVSPVWGVAQLAGGARVGATNAAKDDGFEKF